MEDAYFKKMNSAVLTIEQAQKLRNKIVKIHSSRPSTLLHSDARTHASAVACDAGAPLTDCLRLQLRSDNIFKSPTTGDFAFIDFQLMMRGPPGL
jgi:hypothetical protein